MKSIGIICEYNPFHNGHLYHIKKIKEKYPDSTIVLVLSGNFTERGDASIINKWDKTEIALNYDIDLVIELPFAFATQSADTFSKGAIQILNHLKVDYLCFGSEENNIEKLKTIAEVQINNKKYEKLVKNFMDDGICYPSAINKAIKELTPYSISKPNDILGITYIREILKLNSNIIPFSIKRYVDYNDDVLHAEISSATSIRNAIKNNEDVSVQVPSYTNKFLKEPIFLDNYYSLLKYRLLSDKSRLNIYKSVDEGIEGRINKFIINSKTLDELILKVKTKRYTYNKLNRMFTHILCGFTKEEADKIEDIEYIRVLGFNKKGRLYLKNIKDNIEIPIITRFSDIKNDILDLEFRATCVYASILDDTKKQKLIEAEYKNFPIMR